MYLKQLYRYHKFYFIAVILFMAGQLFINYKRGMVLSPFYHYGMYSHVMDPQQVYTVFEVSVNGKRLEGSNFTPWQWDKIMQPLVFFSNIDSSNRLFTGQVSRLAGKVGWHPDQQHFVQSCDYDAFSTWYSRYLATVINGPVNDVQVLLRTYNFRDGVLKPTVHTQSLAALCR